MHRRERVDSNNSWEVEGASFRIQHHQLVQPPVCLLNHQVATPFKGCGHRLFLIFGYNGPPRGHRLGGRYIFRLGSYYLVEFTWYNRPTIRDKTLAMM